VIKSPERDRCLNFIKRVIVRRFDPLDRHSTFLSFRRASILQMIAPMTQFFERDRSSTFNNRNFFLGQLIQLAHHSIDFASSFLRRQHRQGLMLAGALKLVSIATARSRCKTQKCWF